MQFNQMVCLVGENPLPVYLGIRQFVPENCWGQVHLIHSGEAKGNLDQSTGTAGVAQRIKIALNRQPNLVRLADPYSPHAVDSVIELLLKDSRVGSEVALNYTGGTKVMSALAVLAWHDYGGDLANTIYLQEDEEKWRIGDRDIITPNLDVPISLDNIISLHGPIPDRTPWTIDLKKQDLLNILASAGTFGFPDFVNYAWLKNNIGLPNSPWTKFRDCLTDSTRATWQRWEDETFPVNNAAYFNSRFRKMLEFAHGKWLEDLTERLVKCLTKAGELNYDRIPADADSLVQATNLYSGQPFKVQGQQFESDVVCLVGHRLCYFSMSTNPGNDPRAKVLKSKMFEAVYRSQQLGGGLARSCVISLAGNTRVDECRSSLGNDPHRTIFGLNDLQAWLGGNADSLHRFLTQ